MALKGAEQVLLFDAFFIALLSLYGVQSGVAGPNLAVFQAIPVPHLLDVPVTAKCGQFDYICQGTSGITQATAYIGWAILDLPVLIGYFTVVMISFLNMILGIAFSPAFGPNGVPILGFFFVAMQIIVLFEVFRMFRGSSSGL